MKFKTLSFKFLAKDIKLYNQLKKLTLFGEDGGQSGMIVSLFALKKLKSPNAKVIICYDDYIPVAWALLSREPSNYLVDFDPSMGFYDLVPRKPPGLSWRMN